MTNRDSQLLEVLKIGHNTSVRGEGISLSEALARTSYKELRKNFGPKDLVPIIKTYPALAEEWVSYSEDKRTSGGWYLLNNGEVGRVDHPELREQFSPFPEAVAEYVVRELDFWARKEG